MKWTVIRVLHIIISSRVLIIDLQTPEDHVHAGPHEILLRMRVDVFTSIYSFIHHLHLAEQ